MRNIHKSTPPSFRRGENVAAILKAPPQGGLAKGPDRKFPGLHLPLGGATSPSLSTNRRFAFLSLAFLAALAVGLLFLLPGGLLQAQDDGPIMYAENGMGPVATYTATDPEGTAITSWTLAGADAGDFMIDNGVLSFKKSPDFEMPMGGSAGNSNSYEVMVKAMDSTGKTGMEEVKVEVTNVDEVGTVTLSAVQPQSTISFMATLEDLDGTTSNPKWQWAKAGSRNGSYSDIAGATSDMYIPKDPDIGSWLRATVTYTDPEDSGKTAMMKSMYSVQGIRGDNNAPEFAADQDPFETGVQEAASREVPENSPAGTFIGNPVTATDDDGDKLTYTLTGDAAGDFDIDFATGQIMTKADLDNSEGEGPDGTVLMVIVRATDPAGIPQADRAVPENSATVTVNITVTEVNEPPEVTGTTSTITNDGAELMFNEVGDLVADQIDTPLDTYMEMDPEDAGASTWSVAGPDGGKFTAVMGALKFKAKPDYEMPTDANKDNVYEVTVQAADADGNTGMKMVKVTVMNVDELGIVTLDKVRPRVGIAVTASLEDPDGSISGLTWAWTDSDNVALGGTDTNSDTYTPVADDADKTLTATAMYTDGEDSGKTATANSTNMVAEDTRNLPPKFEDQDTETDGVQNTMTTREVEENTKALAGDDADAEDPPEDDSADNVGSAVNAADPDPNADPLTYTLGGADAAMFRVRQDNTVTENENEGGQIEVAAGTKLDYETKQTYMVTVMAEDSFGATASIEVTIMVKDLDEMPEIMVTGKDSVMYAENSMDPVATYTAVDPEGTAITSWSLAGDDAGDFMIDNGVLSFKKSPDFEMPMGGSAGNSNSYEVMVKAMDSTGKTGMEEVKVEVTNVDEVGTVTLSAVQPQSTISFMATLEDLDGTTSNPKWQWAKAGSRNGSYSDIAGATSDMYIPKDPDIGSWLRATVTYTDPEDSGKTAMMKSMYSVQGIRGDNNAPEFAADQDPFETGVQEAASREVPENSPAGTFIGNPVTATDDDGDKLTYTLTGDAAGDFDIDFATGQIMTKADLDNSEGEGPDGTVLMVIVRATDPAGIPQADRAVPENSATVTVNITVTEVNEPPEVTGTTSTITNDGAELMFNEVGDLVADQIDTPLDTYMEMDPEDAGASTWSVAGPDGGKFTAVMGALKFKAKPDYEMPTDANKDNVYEVTVQAADADGNTGMKMVKVTVMNVDELGIVTLDKVRPRVGIAVTASLEDPDGSISGLTWAWTDSDNVALGGTDTNSDTYTPVADDADKTLTATAMYTDGEDSGKTATANSTNMVAEDTRNLPPKFEDQDTETDGVQNTMATREVEENTKALAGDDDMADASADNVGSAVNAADPDPNADPLTYTLSGADAAMFRVRQDDTTSQNENEGGQIEVAAGTMLDYEMKRTYMVTVMAEDSFGATASIEVTIMVTDLDEMPEIMIGGLGIGGSNNIEYAENGTAAVQTYTVAGPDADVATWSLSGDDMGDFVLSNDGMLTFRSSPDYEAPADADMDNMYMVTVMANDGTYDAMRMVTVTVTNEMELGRLTGEASVDYMEIGTAAVGTYTANGPVDASWSLEGDDMGAFTIGGSSGELMFATSPDYETPADMGMDNMYMVTVMAKAGGEMDMMAVTVMVTNVDEPGVVTLMPATAPVVGTAVAATLVDPDGGVAGVIWQWYRVEALGEPMEITDATGETYTPVDGDVGARLQATATYTDAHGMQTKEQTTDGVVVSRNTAPEFPATETGDRSGGREHGRG